MSKDCSDNDKDDKSTDENGKVPKTPKMPKTPKLHTTPKSKSAKKRKIEDKDATAMNDSIEVNGTKIEETIREDAVNNDEEA